jgi:hypothetical protein
MSLYPTASKCLACSRAQRHAQTDQHTSPLLFPCASYLKVVWHAPVQKDVHKQLSFRLQPLRDAGHKEAVVLHMFEHLDGYNAVVYTGWGKLHDIGCYDLEWVACME